MRIALDVSVRDKIGACAELKLKFIILARLTVRTTRANRRGVMEKSAAVSITTMKKCHYLRQPLILIAMSTLPALR